MFIGCGGDVDSDLLDGLSLQAAQPSNGVLETETFRISEGEAMNLDSDLAVFATEDIEISGELRVAVWVERVSPTPLGPLRLEEARVVRGEMFSSAFGPIRTIPSFSSFGEVL